MPVFQLLGGAALLAFGRKLFWVFVGLVGFFAGLKWGAVLFPNEPEWVVFAAALLTGIIGAVLAMVLQRLAAGLAGFVAGSYLAASIAAWAGGPSDQALVAFQILLGLVCGVMMVVMFDWVLIILSSLIGAAWIIEAVQPAGAWHALAYVLLAAAGIAFQAWQLAGYRQETVVTREASREPLHHTR
jgi:uncharacterized protein DUF4203